MTRPWCFWFSACWAATAMPQAETSALAADTAGLPAPVALHEDADLLVLCKPSGLLCVPGCGPDKQDCLSARAQQHWPGALIGHRLGQGTSRLGRRGPPPEEHSH